MNINNIPWVEKYRPTSFDDIVMNNINRDVMTSILENNYFPNLLFYGPPGTGKTTTIINLINKFLEDKLNIKKGLMIHLNASDERGIEVIRVQINNFVSTMPLFNNNVKFVILDEVDYMTKNAQQALKYLLQSYNKNVRFCLICNYISRIDESLQNEFVRLRFNQLPEKNIINFLSEINSKEKLGLSIKTLKSIQKYYKSDIRSMINYMQSKFRTKSLETVPDKCVWNKITEDIKNLELKEISNNINDLCMNYNIELCSIIKSYLNYIIIENICLTPKFLNMIEFILHSNTSINEEALNYLILHLKDIFNGE